MARQTFFISLSVLKTSKEYIFGRHKYPVDVSGHEFSPTTGFD